MQRKPEIAGVFADGKKGWRIEHRVCKSGKMKGCIDRYNHSPKGKEYNSMKKAKPFGFEP